MTDSLERAVYTVDEAAELLGIGRAMVYQAVKDKTLPSIRIGRRVLIPKAVLDRLLGVEVDADV